MDFEDLLKEGKLKVSPRTVTKNYKENDTLYPDYEVVHKPTPCDDCNLVVTNKKTLVYKRIRPVDHWINKCQHCNLAKHPESGKMVTVDQVGEYYRQKKTDLRRKK